MLGFTRGGEARNFDQLTLKARKLSGREGFLVLFHITSDDDRVWWNLGGWNNTQDAIESGATLDGKPGHIETGRWYDIRVDVRGDRVKCYLDGSLVHDIDYHQGGQVKALYACAAREQKTGDVIVKVVNTSATPLETEIDFSGAKSLAGTASETVLTSEEPADENSLNEPTKVSPRVESMDFNGASFTQAFPGNSFTILRLQNRN